MSDDVDDYLYVCPECSVVTIDDVATCPACHHTGDRLTLALTPREGWP